MTPDTSAYAESSREDLIKTARVVRTGTFGRLSAQRGARDRQQQCAVIEFYCSRTKQHLMFTTHIVQSEYDEYLTQKTIKGGHE